MRSINFIYGTDASEYLPGTDGVDAIFGAGGNDTLEGLRLADSLYGEAGDDIVRGGAGGDSLDGGEGRDRLNGGAGADQLAGGDGRDHLNGGADADALDGGAGRDRLNGGAGDDALTGGDGRDQFVFVAPAAGSGAPGFGTDVITDLELHGPERGGDRDFVVVKGYGGFASVDEFNLFAAALNEDGDPDTGAAAVGDDAVLSFGTDGTIVITGGADLFV